MADKWFYNQVRTHPDGDGQADEDLHSFRIPDGKKYTRYSLELLSAPGISGAEVVSRPAKGAAGVGKIKVRWYHAPFASVKYRLHAYAGSTDQLVIAVGSNDWVGQATRAIEQKLRFSLRVRGPDARELFRIFAMAQGQALPEYLLPENDFTDGGPDESVRDLYFTGSDDGNGSGTWAAATTAPPASQAAPTEAPIPAPVAVPTAEVALAERQTLQPSEAEAMSTIEGPTETGQTPAPLQEPVTTVAITLAVVFTIVTVAAFALIGTVLIAAIQNGLCPTAKHKGSVGSSVNDELSIDINPCK